jgi:5-methylcytosine-specific restriction endonuclease McrA
MATANTRRHRDLVQYNWYRYGSNGFTEVQQSKYAHSARYYSQAVKATPVWANMNAVWDMFLYARLCRDQGVDMQTDHIVPINHPHVCGLHCESNLQQLTTSANNKKSNKWWPDMWEVQLELHI